ncbi:MAG: valine--tRNA ligase [Gemmatimonadaceae bacterium]
MTTPPTAEIPAQYDPAATEREWYERWLAADAFTADSARSNRAGGDRDPFTIVMPPPNVTAVLHVGHGLNITVQDVITRWRRMRGDETLWLPGTDHAGIATQNIVEKQLAREGQTRFDLGREKFVARTTEFVTETGGTILEQLRSIGASCDWTRTAYTLSPELSVAVREAFVQLHERGLIYRGHRVIHWCPRCLTSLSDEEAEHDDEMGSLYHIRYPVVGEAGRWLTVATTRPETMLGDVAVAVNPADTRYASLIGKTVMLPIAEIEIPIIADEYADPEFGTGVVKVTPAHDPNDYEVGKRHNLAMPVIMTAEGTLDNGSGAGERVPPELRGVDRFEARARIVATLKEGGELEKIEAHKHAVRHCYRCGTVVEPRLSDQWFVRMRELAAPALEGVRSGRIRILPERWEAVYINWLEGIRDWNISRQLWWGHRIPVWYCEANDCVTVSRTDISTCPKCGGAVHQDEDVLDTWFSSWLWPFSTLGWPDKSAVDLKAFYSTDDLVTAPEILFFWVARMVMAGYAFMGDAPFHTIYLHGTVRDTEHVKMSKSLGNGIDPLDVVRLYGADALRYTVIAGMGMGADLVLDPHDLERSFAPGRNFATKLWNIGRFLLTKVGDEPVASVDGIDDSRLARADRWILARLNVAIAECDASFGPPRPESPVWKPDELHSGMRLNEYAESARRFVWNEIADWYLESVKARVASRGPDRDVARAVLVHVFDGALRLLHPVIPFITEALWQRLPARQGKDSALLCTAAWPLVTRDRTGSNEFERVRECVDALRAMRAEHAVPPGRMVHAVLVNSPSPDLYLQEAALIGQLARATLTLGGRVDGPATHALLPDSSDLVLSLGGLVDIEQEERKLSAELAQLEKQLASLQGRLANETFTARAPANIVEAERTKERDWASRVSALRVKIHSLGAGAS